MARVTGGGGRAVGGHDDQRPADKYLTQAGLVHRWQARL